MTFVAGRVGHPARGEVRFAHESRGNHSAQRVGQRLRPVVPGSRPRQRRPARRVRARLPRFGPHLAPPPPPSCRRWLPSGSPVPARLRPVRGTHRRTLPDRGLGPRRARTARVARRRRRLGDHRTRLGCTHHAHRRESRTRCVAQGRVDGGATGQRSRCGVHRQPRADQAQLVHVLLPASAFRSGGGRQRPRVHRHAVGRLVAWLRRTRRSRTPQTESS